MSEFYTDVKRWWKSKTVWFGNLLMGSAPVLEYARDNSTLLAEYIGKATSLFVFITGAVVVWLRKKTTNALGRPDKQE